MPLAPDHPSGDPAEMLLSAEPFGPHLSVCTFHHLCPEAMGTESNETRATETGATKNGAYKDRCHENWCYNNNCCRNWRYRDGAMKT